MWSKTNQNGYTCLIIYKSNCVGLDPRKGEGWKSLGRSPVLETCLIKKGKLIIKHIMVDWHLLLMTTVGVSLLSSATQKCSRSQNTWWNISNMTDQSIYTVKTSESQLNWWAINSWASLAHINSFNKYTIINNCILFLWVFNYNPKATQLAFTLWEH